MGAKRTRRIITGTRIKEDTLRPFFCTLALTLTIAIPPHARAAISNPCTLLSLAEARSITGLTLKSPTPNPLRADGGQDKSTSCSYQNDANQGVVVTLHDDAAFFPGSSKRPNTEGFKRVPGIGQRAWTSAMAVAVSVDVLKGGRYVSVGITNMDGLKDRGARNYAQAIKLAKLVASRL
jgi:hypothetical protein